MMIWIYNGSLVKRELSSTLFKFSHEKLNDDSIKDVSLPLNFYSVLTCS